MYVCMYVFVGNLMSQLCNCAFEGNLIQYAFYTHTHTHTHTHIYIYIYIYIWLVSE